MKSSTRGGGEGDSSNTKLHCKVIVVRKHAQTLGRPSELYPVHLDVRSTTITQTPRRYKDAHLKSEFHDMALRNDVAIFEEEDGGDTSLVMANRQVSNSEEELDTGEIRQ